MARLAGFMALIVFLRGMNVGGYRRFRPAMLAKELEAFGVVNVGAAGTFIVRHPGTDAEAFPELLRRLPFEAKLAVCGGEDLLRLAEEDPFGPEPARPGLVRFVSFLTEAGHSDVFLPTTIPETGEWFVRVLGRKDRLVFGVYRRCMRSIGYLGQMDALFGATVTTRSWGTVVSLLRILRADQAKTAR